MMRQLLLSTLLLLTVTALAELDQGRKILQDGTTEVQVLENIAFGFLGIINEGRNTIVEDFEACQKLCDDTATCKAFTYFKAEATIFEEGSCFLYNLVPQGVDNPAADSGILPPKVSNPAVCETKDGVSYIGRIVLDGNLVRVSSAEECCLRCQENDECIVYTYLGGSSTCWLKKTKVAEVPCEDCSSGIVDDGEFADDVIMIVQDDPEPPNGGEWDNVKTGVLQETIDIVWESLKDPRFTMSLGFRHLGFATTGDDETVVVELSSKESFIFNVVETSEDNMYHIYEIVDHSSGVLRVPPDNVTFIGSFTFAHLIPDIKGGTIVNWGFQGNIGPDNLIDTAGFFFEKFMEIMIQNLKLEFGSGDCLEDPKLREPQGTCNNPMIVGAGEAFTPLARLDAQYDPQYADGVSEPSGSDISPRLISNTLSVEGTNEDDATNRLRINDMHIYLGQFLDHDTDLSPKGSLVGGFVPFFSLSRDSFVEQFPIPVPDDDPYFTGEFKIDEIKFARGVWQRRDNEDVTPRQHLNELSAFLDLGPVYGNDNVRAAAVRSFEGGKLKTSDDGFLPLNGINGVGINLENVPNANSSFFVAGDVRCSEDVNLLVIHNLFNREHNLIADELDEAFEGSLSDEEIFQYAKSISIAVWQSIVYNEYLPLILCPDDLKASDWVYDPDLDARVDSFFSTVSFRFGHSMVGNIVWKVKPGSDVPPEEPSERLLLRDTFERMAGDIIDGTNWDEYLMGLVWHEARELDTKMVDEMRTFLFTKNRDAPSNDLVAINIQRARDFGLPMYNDARAAHGLERVTSFSEITDDEDLAARMEEVYQGDVDLVDAFIGGLAEKPSLDCRLTGDLFYTSIRKNFERIRDGDRLFYKGFPFSQELLERYPRLNDIIADRVTLGDIMVRNSLLTQADIGGPDRGNVMVMP